MHWPCPVLKGLITMFSPLFIHTTFQFIPSQYAAGCMAYWFLSQSLNFSDFIFIPCLIMPYKSRTTRSGRLTTSNLARNNLARNNSPDASAESGSIASSAKVQGRPVTKKTKTVATHEDHDGFFELRKRDLNSRPSG